MLEIIKDIYMSARILRRISRCFRNCVVLVYQCQSIVTIGLKIWYIWWQIKQESWNCLLFKNFCLWTITLAVFKLKVTSKKDPKFNLSNKKYITENYRKVRTILTLKIFNGCLDFHIYWLVAHNEKQFGTWMHRDSIMLRWW